MSTLRAPIITAPVMAGSGTLPSTQASDNGIANLTNQGMNLPQGLPSGKTASAPQGEADLRTQGMRMPGETTEQENKRDK